MWKRETTAFDVMKRGKKEFLWREVLFKNKINIYVSLIV